MKKSDLLEKAKKYLWNGSGIKPNNKNVHVCVAISIAAKKHYKDYFHPVALEIRDYIDEALGAIGRECSSVKNFIGIDKWNKATTEQQQDYRKRWIDAMIKDYQQRGE